MAATERSARVTEGLALVSIALIFAAVTLIVTYGNAESISCAQFPACLADPGTIVGTVHTYAAGVLVLLVIGLTLITYVARRAMPGAFPATALALLVLLVAASFGALFATGVIPVAWAPIQFLWFAIVLALLGYVTIVADRRRRRPATST
ncbi:MAG: hypothetical protein ACREBT_00090 [Thermoplasmata archaeon]